MRSRLTSASNMFFLICLMFSTIVFPTCWSQDRNIEGIIMPGIYLQELDDSSTFTTYDKVIPLVFEFKVFNGLSTTTPPSTPLAGYGNILAKLACRNENQTSPIKSTTDWIFTCPIFYHVNNLLTQFRSNWTNIHPFLSPTPSVLSSFRTNSAQTFLSTDSSTTGISLDDECKNALRGWRGIDPRNDAGFSAYKTIIERCSVESYFEESIQDYNLDLTTNYEKIRDSMVNHFGADINSSPNAGVELIGILLGIQNLMLTQTTVELNRWKDVVDSCQNGLIPTSILKPSKLDKVLQELRSRLLTKKYSLAFGSSLQKLFKLKLVDCVLGQNSFYIQILLPIVQENNIYKSLSIHQPAFLYATDNICYVNSNTQGKGARFSLRNFIYEKNSKLLVETDCNARASPLCQFPDKSSRLPTTDACLFAIVFGSMENIKNYCHLECEKILSPTSPLQYQTPYRDFLVTTLSTNSFPLIQRIDSDKFIITLNKMSTLLIKCEALGRLDEFIPPQKYGAVEVTLPCSCYLMYHSEKYYAYEPCSNLITYATMQHVIPIHMINTSIQIPRITNGPFSTSSNGNLGRAGILSNSRLRYLQPRNRITFPNVTMLINMTFHEDQLVEVMDDKNINDDEDDELVNTDSGNNASTSPSSDPALTSPSIPTPAPSSLSDLCENNSIEVISAPSHYNQHSALWSLLIIQGLVISLLLVFILFKFRVIDKRIEDVKYGCSSGVGGGINGISFSVSGASGTNNSSGSQIMLTEKY